MRLPHEEVLYIASVPGGHGRDALSVGPGAWGRVCTLTTILNRPSLTLPRIVYSTMSACYDLLRFGSCTLVFNADLHDVTEMSAEFFCVICAPVGAYT